MQRILSTYRFLNQQLNNALIGEIAAAGFTAVEVFCAPHHFNYNDPQAVRELGDALREHKLTLHSLHAPTERDWSPGRESGVPLSISDPERIRRLDAVDEIKRTLEVTEKIPCKYLIQHIGHGRQTADPRKLDAAFTSLENLAMFAKARGTTIALENTPSELGSPSVLHKFLVETHLHDLKLCFDIGHAHIEEGVAPGFEAMRDHLVSSHIHDNHGDKDEHSLPFDGTIDWDAALRGFVDAPQVIAMVFEIKGQGATPPSLDQISAACGKIEEKISAMQTGTRKARS
ncbi:MAG TPA: sugar phosphate isomerase/epimerase family protein [Candidatus Acidoferrales bacterium]